MRHLNPERFLLLLFMLSFKLIAIFLMNGSLNSLTFFQLVGFNSNQKPMKAQPSKREVNNYQTITKGTMSTQNANSVAITGGSIDGTPIGNTTTSSGKFTTLNATSGISGGGF
jgi:hypothetical protein